MYKKILFLLFFVSDIIYAATISIDSQSPATILVDSGTSVTVAATVDTVVGEETYLKYTTDSWSTVHYIHEDWSVDTYPNAQFVIPAQPAGTYVEYLGVITSEVLSNPDTDNSSLEVAWGSNSGSNYGYCVPNGKTITLKYKNASASAVQLEGTFDLTGSNGVFTGTYNSGTSGWDTANGYTFSNDGSGNWTITLTLNYDTPVQYEYKFLVDSVWTNDPRNLDSTVGTENNNQFTMNAVNHSPTVSVLFPNGGELLSGTTSINWSASDPDSGDAVTVDIYVSPNGGTSWESVASGISNTGSFSWDTSAETGGSQYLVKVTATDGYASSSDQSNNVFGIQNSNSAPTVSLSQPDGGEVVSGNYEIKWSASDVDGDTVTLNIDYSSDSGSTWNSIATGEANDGSFLWDTTSVADGTNYRIRLTASDGSLTSSDVSSSDFEVRNSTANHPPTVTVTYPNGGETLSGNQNITWVASDPDGDTVSIKLEYSADSGATWNTIASAVSNSGSYQWDTSSVANGSSYEIRVTASDGKDSASDSSDAVFSVSNGGANGAPIVSLTYPTGGETLSGSINITWTASDPDNDTVTLNLYISGDGGLSWSTIDTDIANSGSYSFNTASVSDGTNYVIKIVATDGSLSSLAQSTAFTILNGSSLPQLKLTTSDSSVSTGTVFDVNVDLANISNVFGGNINISYPSALVEVVGASSGTFLTGSVSCLTKDFSSDGYYNIGISKLGNVSGDSGSGEMAKISFRAKTNGTADISFKSNTKIRDPALSEISVQPVGLSITIGTGENLPPVVSVDSPNGGEAVSGNYKIKWTASDPENATLLITIEYTSDKTTYHQIASNLSNTGSYTWDTTAVPDGAYWIRAIAYDGVQYASDLSDASFTLYNGSGNHAPTVSLISPVGGETLAKKALIVWSANDADKDNLKITLAYSSDGGATYSTIASDISNSSSYIWDISSLAVGSDYVVKVTASDGSSSTSDWSDNTFTIASPDSSNNPPQPVVFSPNGGETAGGDYNISWLYLDPDGDLISATTIWYSSDGGSSWEKVYTTTSSVNSYHWDTKRFSDSSSGLLKVSIFDGKEWRSDVSNAVFSLANETPRIVADFVFPKPSSKGILTDFGVSESTSNGLKIVFSKAMNTDSVEYNFTLINEESGSVIRNGTFLWSDDKKEAKYQLPSGTVLSPNTNYKIVINIGSLGAQDESGIPLEASASDGLKYEWEFTTAMSSNSAAVVSEMGSSVSFPAGAFPAQSQLYISKSVVSGIVPPGLADASDESFVYTLKTDSNSDGIIDSSDSKYAGNLSRLTTISIPYTDSNNDGIEDDKGLDVTSLKVYRLVSGNWVEVNDGGINCVDVSSKVVKCDVIHFSTYTILGKKFTNTSVSNIRVYPNPFYPGKGQTLQFDLLPDAAKVKIFDLSGAFIKELSVDQTFNKASWQGIDDGGNSCASGIYFYLVTSPSGNRKGKIGLIR